MSFPILWWKAENNAIDSKQGLSGAWRGTEAYTTGVLGNAFDFNGTSSIKVDNNDIFEFTPSGTFSVRCYFKINNWSDTRGIVAIGNDVNTWNWYISIFSQRVYLAYGGVSINTPTLDIDNSNWYDLLVTYNNGYWIVYINGTIVYSPATQHLIGTSVTNPSLVIGSIALSAGRFNGQIDELRIYDTVITSNNMDGPMVPTHQKLNLLLAKEQSALGTKAPAPLTMTDQSAVDDTFSLDYVKEFQGQSLAQAIFGQPQAVAGSSMVDVKVTLPIIPTGSATVPNVGRYLNCCGMQYALATAKHSWTPSSAVNTHWKDMSLNAYTGDKVTGDSILTKTHSVMYDFEISGEVGKPVMATFTGKGVPDGVPAAATYLTDSLTPLATVPPAMLKNATQTINGISYTILKFNLKGGNDVQLIKSMADDSGYLQATITGVESVLTATVYMEDSSAKNPLVGMAAGTLATTTLKFGNATGYLISIISGASKSEIRSAKMSSDQNLMTWDLEIRFVDNNYTIAINDAA